MESARVLGLVAAAVVGLAAVRGVVDGGEHVHGGGRVVDGEEAWQGAVPNRRT